MPDPYDRKIRRLFAQLAHEILNLPPRYQPFQRRRVLTVINDLRQQVLNELARRHNTAPPSASPGQTPASELPGWLRPPHLDAADAKEAALLYAAFPDDPRTGDPEAQYELARRLQQRGQKEAADYWFFWAAMGGLLVPPSEPVERFPLADDQPDSLPRPDYHPANDEEAALLDAALPNNPQMGDHHAQLKLARCLQQRGEQEAADYWFFYAAMGGLYDSGDPFER